MQIVDNYSRAEVALTKYKIVGINVRDVTSELTGLLIKKFYDINNSITLYEEVDILIIEVRPISPSQGVESGK